MKRITTAAAAAVLLITTCSMGNPFSKESKLPYGAPQFDKIRTSDYLPAIKAGIKEAKAEVDAIISNPVTPSFQNTVEAMEYSGEKLNRVTSIFFALMESDTNEDMQNLAEEISPMLTEFGLYVSLNRDLFAKVKYVYEHRDSTSLDKDQLMLLKDTYKSFVNSGANLSDADKEVYSKLSEELSLLGLKFSKNLLASTNAYTLNITDPAQLAGLPRFALEMAAQTAKDKGQEGWTFDLSYPSMSTFMKYSECRELRREIWSKYNSRAFGGEFDNSGICKDIVEHRIKIANLLGYDTFADYQVEDRMVKSVANVNRFLGELAAPAMPVAKAEIDQVCSWAVENGFDGEALMPWDFSYWSEKYKTAKYDISDEMLKPYFRLESCIDAVLGLATTLYGLQFEERSDLPVYQKDVKVFDVKDADGRHLALFYVDFFPRESKRGGAWMTDFRGQSIRDGVERRPFVNLVTNFTKPTAESPSLLTHDELVTFLHEFGHSLHGIMAEGRYGSQTGTNVDHDFVELPSQIMENWAYEPEFLKTFAKHYQTGEVIPDELITKIVETKNYLSAYYHTRQLQYATLDMAWHTLKSVPGQSVEDFEKQTVERFRMLPAVSGTCMSTAFSHIFSGGYAAGYYSYKWAEVLEADAFSLFLEKGIFNTEVSHSFRENILSKGGSEDAGVLYRNFRGHDPEPRALLVKLGIINSED